MLNLFTTKLEDLDLEWLKKNHSRLYYFGLGFIQLKIDERYRLHFYSPELPTLTEDVHNHRYLFCSKTLKGKITHKFWKEIVGDTHVLVNESCNPDIKAPSEQKLCSIVPYGIETFTAGKICVVAPHQFHQVSAVDCITLLDRSSYVTQYAKVIYPVGARPVCPFSVKYQEDELWAMIERMLHGI